MDDGAYSFHDPDDDRGGRHAQYQQHSLLQPRFLQPTRPVQPRDRYRASRHEPQYDRVEDDEYEDEVPLDSFNERLNDHIVQQSYIPRQQEAAIGQARLSFPPRPTKFHAASAAPQPQLSRRVHEGAAYGFDERSTLNKFRPQLAHCTYNATQPQESSSDVRSAGPSSPAFRASQRQGRNATLSATQQVERHRQDRGAPVLSDFDDIPQAPRAGPQASAPVWAILPHRNAPICQGIPLVPISELPDRLRTIFPYPNFNAVQSKCFDSVYKSDDNFVLASPTGSGKTAILELAVCRAIATNATGQYKIVYQAPTKSLCSERQHDWQTKFSQVGLKCVELTGDSDAADLRNVQSANVIITTPEKWDTITRKWKDHEKLMRLIRLFLIDEVHILKEDRGATLEAIVSRMKTIATDVRFVALSATVPNLKDVAMWLGKNSAQPKQTATCEKFGEEFRPVRLRKHVSGYPWSNANDFAFEKSLDGHLPAIITKHSAGKPVMIFCCTRNSTVATAKALVNWWATRQPRDRPWAAPAKHFPFRNSNLRDCAASGVAFHHAGIESDDRIAVEKAFLKGGISVICCTSTLAVGVNLPCHLVIIKNTVTFTGNILQEYSDLEVMQMLGRAGRPQFDDSAVAVIMTRQHKVAKYEKMVTGNDILESTLHLNLIDHMNAEIGLGTIRDSLTARKWLTSTFLYVRLKQNPEYYKLDGSRSGQSVDEQLDDICHRDVTLLRECNLIAGDEYLQSTEFGHAMARYCIHFDSMRTLMGLQPKASISEILSAVAQCSEFESIRFRSGEKALYKTINKSPYLRFPIPVNLDLPAHKVSLLIQSVLGGTDISWDGDLAKHRIQYTTETSIVFKHCTRLVRCVIDCQICLGDSVSINNALMLERSLAARVWDDSPLQMKQIDGIGVIGVRKLANIGVRSIEELDCTDAHRIEGALGRNPPFGLQILEKLKSFPKLRVSLTVRPNSTQKTPEGAKLLVKADIGFLNEKTPESFNSRPVYVCLLAETSDGRKAHFSRTSAKHLHNNSDLNFSVLLTGPNLSINCYIMCEGIAGTSRSASVTPKVFPSMFPAPKPSEPTPPPTTQRPMSNISRRRIESGMSTGKASTSTDEFGDSDIDDDALVKASIHDLDFDHIDNYANPTEDITRKNTAKNTSSKDKLSLKMNMHDQDNIEEPKQLENGNWACNHRCKDKQACKHMCCREGVTKPPKKTTEKRVPSSDTASQAVTKGTADRGKKTQTKLQLSASKRKGSTAIEELDLTRQEKRKKADYAANVPRDYRALHRLHKVVQKKDNSSTISSVAHQKPAYCYGEGGNPLLSFMAVDSGLKCPRSWSSDYGDVQPEDLTDDLHQPERGNKQAAVSKTPDDAYELGDSAAQDRISEVFGDDESLFGEAMVGIADSEELREADHVSDDYMHTLNNSMNDDHEHGMGDEDLAHVNTATQAEKELYPAPLGLPTSSSVHVPSMPPEKGRSLFFDDTSGPGPSAKRIDASSAQKEHSLRELKQAEWGLMLPPKTSRANVFEGQPVENAHKTIAPSALRDVEPEKASIPEAYKDLEPWIFKEFGDIVELID